jgi:SAM-dependent methyltransferase
MRVTYNPLVFEQKTEDAARAIIVTPEDGLSTEHRWQYETPYLAELIGEQLALEPGQLVLDYGCGIGRIAKALIERFGVSVLGVDQSQAMRGLAPGYVGAAPFSIVSNDMLRELVEHGFQADAAIAIWVLQHCVRPQDDIAALSSSSHRLFVLNNFHRAVPTLEAGWVNDGTDIKALLDGQLNLKRAGSPNQVIGPRLAAQTYWATYDRKR